MASVDDAKRAWARSYEGLGREEIDKRILVLGFNRDVKTLSCCVS